MNLQAIREQRAAHVAEMRALLTAAESEKRSLTAEQQTQFDALKAKVTSLEADEARAQFLQDAERRMQGRPAGGDTPDFDAACRQFSLRAAICSQIPNSGVDAGREREVGQELARRSGRTFEGIPVPVKVFEQRVVTTAAPAGGPGSNLIATDHRGDLYIDRLRAALRIRQLGATVLAGLVGNVDIPKLKTSATAGWIAENAAISASDAEFTKVSMSPKHVGCRAEYSRNMLMQSSPDIEALLRNDFAKVLAEAVDAAAIKGGGSNEPTGILATSGIGDVERGVNGGMLLWETVIDLLAAIEINNAQTTGFLTNGTVVKTARQSAKIPSTDSALIMEEPNRLAGYPLVSTNLVPANLTKGTSIGVCSALIAGDWSELLLGYWSELDILVNPFESTAYSKGNVQIRGMISMDIDVRHPESFAAIKDLVDFWPTE